MSRSLNVTKFARAGSVQLAQRTNLEYDSTEHDHFLAGTFSRGTFIFKVDLKFDTFWQSNELPYESGGCMGWGARAPGPA